MSDTVPTSSDAAPSDAPSSSAVEAPSTPPPASAPDASPPSSGSQTDSQTAPSSGDSRQSDREGLLEAVRKVVVTKPEKPALPAQGDEDSAEDQAAEDTSQDQVAAPGEPQEPAQSEQPTAEQPDDINAPDPTEGELKRYGPKTRRRVEQLLAQRNQARSDLAAIQPELAQHRQLQGYLNEHQLAPDDVNVLLGVGAALRRQDYRAFLDGVTPYVMAAQEALGIRIAPDIQKQVDDGLVSEEAARELTRTRHRAAQAEHRLQQQNQAVTSDTQNRALAEIRSGVDEWEAMIRKRDPDYAHKSVAVRRFSQALLQERGYPTNRAQAVELAQAAYDEATRELTRMRPKPLPTRPVPSGNHVATGGAPQQPRTMKEAALQALADMRRAS